MDEPSTPRAAPVYPNVKQEYETVQGFPIVTAEASIASHEGGRLHKRVLGASPQWPETLGKPIVYSDSYVRSPGEETYAYARHDVDYARFLVVLDYFFQQQRERFPELMDRTFPCWLNQGGKLVEAEVPFPFSLHLPANDGEMEFIRMSLPFGDLSIEFSEPSVQAVSELDFLRRRALQKFVESPLFGFDASSSTVLVPLMAEIHWAAKIVPRRVLGEVLQQFASNPIPA